MSDMQFLSIVIDELNSPDFYVRARYLLMTQWRTNTIMHGATNKVTQSFQYAMEEGPSIECALQRR